MRFLFLACSVYLFSLASLDWNPACIGTVDSTGTLRRVLSMVFQGKQPKCAYVFYFRFHWISSLSLARFLCMYLLFVYSCQISFRIFLFSMHGFAWQQQQKHYIIVVCCVHVSVCYTHFPSHEFRHQKPTKFFFRGAWTWYKTNTCTQYYSIFEIRNTSVFLLVCVSNALYALSPRFSINPNGNTFDQNHISNFIRMQATCTVEHETQWLG